MIGSFFETTQTMEALEKLQRQDSKYEIDAFPSVFPSLSSRESEKITVNGKLYKATNHEVPKTMSECHVIDRIDPTNGLTFQSFSCLTCVKTGQRVSMSLEIFKQHLYDVKESLKKSGYYPLEILIDSDYSLLESCKKSDWLICQDDPSGMREVTTWDHGPIGIHAKETLWVKIKSLPTEIQEMIESTQRFDIFTNSLFEKFYVYEHRPMSLIEIKKLEEFNTLVISLGLENPEEIEKLIPEEIKDRLLPLVSFESLAFFDSYDIIRYNDIYRSFVNIFYDIEKFKVNYACKLIKTCEESDSFVTEKQLCGVFVDEYFERLLLVVEESDNCESIFRWYEPLEGTI